MGQQSGMHSLCREHILSPKGERTASSGWAKCAQFLFSNSWVMCGVERVKRCSDSGDLATENKYQECEEELDSPNILAVLVLFVHWI